MDWPHQVDAERLYDAAGPYPLVFASYWALMLTWALVRDIPTRSRVT